MTMFNLMIIFSLLLLVSCDSDRDFIDLKNEVNELYRVNNVLKNELLNKKMLEMDRYEKLQLERLRGDKIKASKVYKDGCLSFRNHLKRQSVKLDGDQWDYCENMKLYEGYIYFNGKEYAYKS